MHPIQSESNASGWFGGICLILAMMFFAAPVRAGDEGPALPAEAPDVQPAPAITLADEVEVVSDEQLQAAEARIKTAEVELLQARIELERLRHLRRMTELTEQLSAARAALAETTPAVDSSEGFIHSWLVIGPIPVDEKVANHDEESNKELLDRHYLPAQDIPAPGETVKIDDMDRTWREIESKDYFVDLTQVANDSDEDPEQAAYVGVVYITSDQELAGVTLAIGSQDDSVWRLNGREVVRAYGKRTIEKDQDTAEALTLEAGGKRVDVVVLNGEGASAAAARFLDEDGNPIQGLKFSTTPPPAQITATDITPATDDDSQ